jgi:hypothetical protein
MKKSKQLNYDLDDYEIKFWKYWLEADSLEKEELVKKLPFVTLL